MVQHCKEMGEGGVGEGGAGPKSTLRGGGMRCLIKTPGGQRADGSAGISGGEGGHSGCTGLP